MMKPDRRVQRTRELLQQAMIALLHERSYTAITIQEISDRANVGRTTFYLHFRSKDDLFMSCHEAVVSRFRHGLHSPHSRTTLLAVEPPPDMVMAYRHLHEIQPLLLRFFQGKESLLLLQRIRDWSARDIATSLQAAYANADSAIPIDVLAHYLAGAQIGLLQWWLGRPSEHTPEQIAQVFQRLQRAAIHDAFDRALDD